ncbi:hypothetical protein MRX96_010611 [Rhipicephalus microplus]
MGRFIDDATFSWPIGVGLTVPQVLRGASAVGYMRGKTLQRTLPPRRLGRCTAAWVHVLRRAGDVAEVRVALALVPRSPCVSHNGKASMRRRRPNFVVGPAIRQLAQTLLWDEKASKFVVCLLVLADSVPRIQA